MSPKEAHILMHVTLHGLVYILEFTFKVLVLDQPKKHTSQFICQSTWKGPQNCPNIRLSNSFNGVRPNQTLVENT